MSFGEVALGVFGFFSPDWPLWPLEHHICKTLESITVLGLVLSLGVENADVIQEAFIFTRHGPILLVASRPLHHVDRTIHFPLLIVALG
jgi:hypothetical protein